MAPTLARAHTRSKYASDMRPARPSPHCGELTGQEMSRMTLGVK
jgi:hypothetical protein